MAGAQSFPGGGGEMGGRVRTFDWAATPLGAIEHWPPTLRAAASLTLHAAFPTMLYWGPDFHALYNDPFVELLGRRHPKLGEPGATIWPETWPDLLPIFRRICKTGEGASLNNRRLMIIRHGERVESWWHSSYTPVIDDGGTVRGVLSQQREITDFILQRRFDQLMLALDERLTSADTTAAKMDAALALIGEHLGVKRTGYGEIAGGMLHIARCWAIGDMPDICGHYPLGTFGPELSESLRAGISVRIEDNLSDERTSDPPTRAAYQRIGLRSGIVVPILDQGRYAGGVFVQDDVPRVWTGHQTALVEAAAARLWAALVRSRAETALKDSEQRYRQIFEQAHDIIFTADLARTVTACNDAAADALGCRKDEVIGRPIADFVSSEDLERTLTLLRESLPTGGTARYDVEVTGCDGRVMLWEINATVALDLDGAPVGLQAVARDVTERRAFDDRRELLIHELNHRVKNTLSLVQGLALQSFRERPADADDFIGRLTALASAHDLLTRDQWEGATIAELVRGATAPLGGLDGRIAATGPNLTVTPRAAVALVMALHELATNAVKYGALSVSEGRVEIAWTEHRDSFRLRWRERDGPRVAEPTRRGFGIKMIERALASDLGGEVSVVFEPKGLVCTIDAPLAPHDGRIAA